MSVRNTQDKIQKTEYKPQEIEKKWSVSTKGSGEASRKIEYNPGAIEKKWQGVWEENKIFSPDLKNAKNPYYTLMMFPYPSAEGLHVGNMYAFTGADIHGRYMRMKGKDVFEPIGLDGFGIHSENYAIKVGKHPREQARISEKNFYRQLHATGNAYDWTRTLETYDPDYYRWTQWIFIQMFKKGLAYRKKARVNWCPSCKTVLADEQVLQKVKSESAKSKVNEVSVGVCERCETEVEKRNLEQWFFRITDYADRLLIGLNEIDWPEKIKIAQRQWIGRSEGARIRFKISNLRFQMEGKTINHKPSIINHQSYIEVFTTRADTLFGATFMVLSPEHPLVSSIEDKNVQEYVRTAKKKTEQERIEEGKEKTGVFSGLYAINPVNNEKIQVWIADYVSMGYGTGAIMAVSAHDQRDFKFAKKYDLPIKKVIELQSSGVIERHPEGVNVEGVSEAYEGGGIIVNSSAWNGWRVPEEIGRVIDWLEGREIGKREVNYRLRDWLISRQRYWGPPIPMIYCSTCEKNSQGEHEDMPGWWTVPADQLPVELPDVQDWRPRSSRSSSGQARVEGPLANHPEFYNVACPECGEVARRETDVSDTFLDSAWYYLRYLSVGNQKFDTDNVPYDIDLVKRWCPVSIYIGGAEHSVLHLLYVRFLAMVLHDLNNSKLKNLALPFEEPFPRFFAHGLIIKERAKMSKSRGNVVIPDEYISKYGADALRMYLIFLGPFSQGGDFRDSGIEGMYRFVKRLWRLFTQTQNSKLNPSTPLRTRIQNLTSERVRFMHKTIKAVTQDLESFSYNTAIARMMEWYNFLSEQPTANSQQPTAEEAEVFLKLLAPFAPHLTEELWQSLHAQVQGRTLGSIHFEAWPEYEEKYLIEDQVTIVVQINGKRRGEIEVEKGKVRDEKWIEEKSREPIQKYLGTEKVKNVIYVPGRIINFVI